MSRASSHHKAGKDRAGSDCAISEVSAVRLVYSMRKQPEQDRYIILASVKPQLQTAIYRVISIVEKTLQAKGLFQDSVSLLNDHCAIADLLVRRTELSSIWDYLIGFYETAIDKIADSLTISFYNQLVALLENDHRTARERPTGLEAKQLELPVIEEAREERPVQEEGQGSMALSNEVEIVEEACVARKEMSAFSLEFIEGFTGGAASGKELKGKVVKQFKVGCLEPGEPMQKWQYFDSLDRGIVRVVFTSRK